MQCKDPKSGESVERFRLMWKEVIYEPGELKAIAFKEGVKIGEAVVRTAGEPFKLRLTPDRGTIDVGGEDLSYLLIEALDREGNVCPLANNLVEIELKGMGRIAGVGNGNPQSMDPFQAKNVRLFHGKAMLIVASGNTEGDIKVTATSEELKGASVGLSVR